MVEFDDGVVAVAVSPGDEDGEAEMGGTGEEGGFGGFSATLAGGLGGGVEGDGLVVGQSVRGEWLDQDWGGVVLRIVKVVSHRVIVGCCAGRSFLMSPKNTNGAGLIPAPLFKLYTHYITLPGVKVT